MGYWTAVRGGHPRYWTAVRGGHPRYWTAVRGGHPRYWTAVRGGHPSTPVSPRQPRAGGAGAAGVGWPAALSGLCSVSRSHGWLPGPTRRQPCHSLHPTSPLPLAACPPSSPCRPTRCCARGLARCARCCSWCRPTRWGTRVRSQGGGGSACRAARAAAHGAGAPGGCRRVQVLTRAERANSAGGAQLCVLPAHSCWRGAAACFLRTPRGMCALKRRRACGPALHRRPASWPPTSTPAPRRRCTRRGPWSGGCPWAGRRPPVQHSALPARGAAPVRCPGHGAHPCSPTLRHPPAPPPAAGPPAGERDLHRRQGGGHRVGWVGGLGGCREGTRGLQGQARRTAGAVLQPAGQPWVQACLARPPTPASCPPAPAPRPLPARRVPLRPAHPLPLQARGVPGGWAGGRAGGRRGGARMRGSGCLAAWQPFHAAHHQRPAPRALLGSA